MTSSRVIEPTRTIAIYICTRGFSYAVMDNALTLIETNLISPKKFDEAKLLEKIKKVVTSFGDITLILEDYSCKNNRKGERSRNLNKKVHSWAQCNSIVVKKYSRDDIREVFSRWMAHTKYDISQVLVNNIEGLRSFFYEPVNYPNREPNYEAIFSAVSLITVNYFSLE